MLSHVQTPGCGEGSLVSVLLALHRSKHRYHEPQVYKWSLIWGLHSKDQSHTMGTQGSVSFGVVVEESQPEDLHSKTLPWLLCIWLSHPPDVHKDISSDPLLGESHLVMHEGHHLFLKRQSQFKACQWHWPSQVMLFQGCH